MEINKIGTTMLTVPEVQDILKIGRNRAYDIFNREDFPAICIGRKKVVEQKALDAWLQQRRS